tara:strand:+ start:2039 stop:2413 length:375 start_codon:yes stop_codon:yes gene_type:complete
MGFFGSSKEDKAAKEAAAQAQLEKAQKVKVLTGGLNKEYEVLKVVFQLGSDDGGLGGMLFNTGGRPEEAFANAETLLKAKAAELGCDYIINASFDYRVAVSKGTFGGANQVIEVFAYGTAVKTV